MCRRCGNARVVTDYETHKKAPCPDCVDDINKRAPGVTTSFQLASPPKQKYYSQPLVHVVDRRRTSMMGSARTMCGDFLDDEWTFGRSTVKEPWNDATCSHCIDRLRTARDERILSELGARKEHE